MAQPPQVKPEHCTAALHYLPSPALMQHAHENPKQSWKILEMLFSFHGEKGDSGHI